MAEFVAVLRWRRDNRRNLLDGASAAAIALRKQTAELVHRIDGNEIDGERVDVDGDLQSASDMPATYRVEMDAFPYRFFTAEITAT